jgi:hypothetical protein
MAERADQAARGPLGFGESRKECAYREPVHVAGMDSGEQRLGKICRRLRAEPARHERADGFVVALAPRRHEDFCAHPQLPGP